MPLTFETEPSYVVGIVRLPRRGSQRPTIEILGRFDNRVLKTVSGETLVGADLSGCDLIEADLLRADLRQANLRGAELMAADLRHADLSDADLRGANLSKALVSTATLTGARYDATTCWPAGFRPEAFGAVDVTADASRRWWRVW